MSPTVLPNAIPPYCDVRRGPLRYDQALNGGVHQETILVRVFVNAGAAPEAEQSNLDDYTDPDGAKSIKKAIETDTTLGGIVQDLQVTDCTGDNPYAGDGQPPMLGSEWTVEVWI